MLVRNSIENVLPHKSYIGSRLICGSEESTPAPGGEVTYIIDGAEVFSRYGANTSLTTNEGKNGFLLYLDTNENIMLNSKENRGYYSGASIWNNKEIRLFKNGVYEIKPIQGYVTHIVFTASSKSYSGSTLSFEEGSFTRSTDTTIDWTGFASSVILNIGSGTQLRCIRMEITVQQ